MRRRGAVTARARAAHSERRGGGGARQRRRDGPQRRHHPRQRGGGDFARPGDAAVALRRGGARGGGDDRRAAADAAGADGRVVQAGGGNAAAARRGCWWARGAVGGGGARAAARGRHVRHAHQVAHGLAALEHDVAAAVLRVPSAVGADGCAALRRAVDTRRRARRFGRRAAKPRCRSPPPSSRPRLGRRRRARCSRCRRASCRRRVALSGIFARRYAAAGGEQPWTSFHFDNAAVTVNVALTDDADLAGGKSSASTAAPCTRSSAPRATRPSIRRRCCTELRACTGRRCATRSSSSSRGPGKPKSYSTFHSRLALPDTVTCIRWR